MNRSWSLRIILLASLFTASTANAQSVLFSDDFEGGTANWTMDNLWHLAAEGPPCLDNDSFPSGSHCMWFGDETFGCDYTFAWFSNHLQTVAPIPLPAGNGGILLEFWSRSEVESDTFYDRRGVYVSTDSGANWTEVFRIGPALEPWTFHSLDLSAYAGQTIDLRFTFSTVDSLGNWFIGWLVDDVVVRTVPEAFPTSCFGDGSLAACPCNHSGATGHGCENAWTTGGAVLTVSGSTHPDTILLQSSGEPPSALTIFLQGNAIVPPVAFGDGLRCAGGTLRRLYIKNASGGVALAPALGDLTVSQRAAALGDILDPGSRRYYQTYYRDPYTSNCPPPLGANFNSSTMRKITW
jgi:hypothetical protein